MWYLLIGIVVLGMIAAIAGYFRNRKLQRMLERGEITEIPEPKELEVEYYDDEELDRFRGTAADAYDDAAVDEFRDVLYTLKDTEVAGWLRSLQLRAVNLPDALKDEAFLIVGERRIH